MVRVRVPATTANLGPGFDTLGLALNLYNIVEMELTPGKLEIVVTGQGSETIPTTEENIVFQAALKIWQQVGFSCSGVRIKLINQIPVASGLGSSAAAITGGMVAANYLAGSPFSLDGLLQIAAELDGHPDNVAPAMLGGLVICVKENQDIYYHKIELDSDFQIGAVTPHFPLATKAARQILPGTIPLTDAVFNLGRVSLLIAAITSKKYELLKIAMMDRLHQPYRVQLNPTMEEAFANALKAGALGVALSGSGPTLIALTRENLKEICEAIQEVFLEHNINSTVMHLLPDNHGVQLV